jgi:hypothetical protein
VPVSYIEHPAGARKTAPPAMPNSRGKLLITVRLTGSDSIFNFVCIIHITYRNRYIKWAPFDYWVFSGASPSIERISVRSKTRERY